MSTSLPLVVALLALALTACVRTTNTTADRRALDATEQAWRAAGLPTDGRCLERVEVRRHGTRAAYVEACQGTNPGMGGREASQTAYGCLRYELRGVIGKRVTVIHVAPGSETDMGLVQHEALHAMVRCHLARDVRDPWDDGHTDPLVWTAASKDPAVSGASVQTRALSALADLRPP